MDHGSNSMDFPVEDMHMKIVDQVSNNPQSNHFYVPTEHEGFIDPISGNSGMNSIMIPNNGVGHNESSGMFTSPIWVADQLGHEFAHMQNGMAGEKTSLPVKRKAEVGSLVDNPISQQSLLPNKRPAHVGSDHNPHGFLQPSAPQRKSAPAQSKLSSPGSPAQHSQNKKMVRNDSSGKSGLQRGQIAKKQTAQINSGAKVRSDSSEGVRSKMRESLAGALSLAFKNQDNVPNTEKNKSDAATSHQPLDSQATESDSTKCVHVPVSGTEEVSKTNDSQVFPGQLHPNGSNGNGGQIFQDFQYGSSLPDEGVSFGDTFFAKDDLLQGNGLSWAFEFDVQMGEGKEAQQADKPKSVKEGSKEEVQGNRAEVPTLTPENLAFKIEAELFKLFGGVNKKYREKGRSLLFNLKDRNNPELRERVMSGEISPERLCSMSAEELASKELSEWRMAKAEELAQMKVLPDTEVDIRRLVRKTHKGEYQVEVEHDDGIAAEVSGGASVLAQHHSRKESEPIPPSEASLKDKEKVAGQENSSEDQDFPGSLIIPTDGTDETDLMQGMMVDELKDAEFLPPIVSLDEFMESLNNEPPFENLSVGAAGQKTSISHGESPKPISVSRALNSPKDASSKKPLDVKKQDVATKLSESPAKHKVLPSAVPKFEYMWDGIFQLSLSSTVTVGGLFQSGEKTSTKEWPSALEIKGRVRLEAFEKFLQDLPMSRTRAVMVLQFVLKDKSSDEQRANLSEAIESYSTDNRLGYAEPASGVELYLCPPTSRMTEMLAKYMPKEQRPESDNPIENTLIGVVVWRRAHISNSTISTNSSSHHKHASKRQQPFAPPPKRVLDSSNVNPNSTPTRTTSSSNKAQTEEDDDDIPPGFGPVAAARAARDDDDLPEFNFSGNLTPSVPRPAPINLPQKMSHRPVDQVRELIKKYGQSDASATSSSPISSRGRLDNRNIGIEPWNDDDDDDDIPEWRPQGPLQTHTPHQLLAHLAPTNQHMAPVPPPGGLNHPHPAGGRWVQPPGPLRGARWRH